MFRKMISGLALVFVCTLLKAQTSTSTAIGGDYVDVGGSKDLVRGVRIERTQACSRSAPRRLGALHHLGRRLDAALFQISRSAV
jgi:hypothetical protein